MYCRSMYNFSGMSYVNRFHCLRGALFALAISFSRRPQGGEPFESECFALQVVAVGAGVASLSGNQVLRRVIGTPVEWSRARLAAGIPTALRRQR